MNASKFSSSVRIVELLKALPYDNFNFKTYSENHFAMDDISLHSKSTVRVKYVRVKWKEAQQNSSLGQKILGEDHLQAR